MAERKIHQAIPTNNLAYLHEKAGDKYTFWHSTTFQYICRWNVSKGVFISYYQKSDLLLVTLAEGAYWGGRKPA